MPRHRFASFYGGRAGGEIVTKPLTFKGDSLVLNYATSAPGSVVVEVQDEQGKPVPGFGAAECVPVFGDELERAVSWKGGAVKSLEGQTVRLRIMLVDADVYAIRFRERPRVRDAANARVAPGEQAGRQARLDEHD